MAIEKQLIEAMLAYADDIVPVNRQEIIDFFESKNVPYRQDHVDYLPRTPQYPWRGVDTMKKCKFNFHFFLLFFRIKNASSNLVSEFPLHWQLTTRLRG